MKTAPLWLGRPIVDGDDVHRLETDAAIFEFNAKMPRDQAESKAYENYIREKRTEAAAFHLAGMKAAQGAGAMGEGRKHGMLFEVHMNALGHEPMGPVPPEVQSKLRALEDAPVYKFKAHRGDLFAIEDAKKPKDEEPEDDKLGKSEDGVLPRARREIRACIEAGRHLTSVHPKTRICSHCNWSEKIRASVEGGKESTEPKKGHLKLVKDDDFDDKLGKAEGKCGWKLGERRCRNWAIHRVGSKLYCHHHEKHAQAKQPVVEPDEDFTKYDEHEPEDRLTKMATPRRKPVAQYKGYKPLDPSTVYGQRVQVFRNLNLPGMLTVRDPTGKLIGHLPEAHLEDVGFTVHESGRQRVLAEGRKNVHAWAHGKLVPAPEAPEYSVGAGYNPRMAGSFLQFPEKSPLFRAKAMHIRAYTADTGEEKTGAKIVPHPEGPGEAPAPRVKKSVDERLGLIYEAAKALISND